MDKILIPTVGGFAILSTPGIEEAYLRALATEAELHCEHPWVRQPSAHLVQLCSGVWTHRRAFGGGSTDEAVAGIIAHYGIRRHAEQVGAVLLEPREVAAWEAIQRKPQVGDVEVLADARWGAEAPSYETLRSLLESGMGMGSVYEARVAAVDDGAMQGVEFVGEARPGRLTVAECAVRLAGRV